MKIIKLQCLSMILLLVGIFASVPVFSACIRSIQNKSHLPWLVWLSYPTGSIKFITPCPGLKNGPCWIFPGVTATFKVHLSSGQISGGFCFEDWKKNSYCYTYNSMGQGTCTPKFFIGQWSPPPPSGIVLINDPPDGNAKIMRSRWHPIGNQGTMSPVKKSK